YNIKDDLAYLANQFNENLVFYDVLKKEGKEGENLAGELCKRSAFLYEKKDEFLKQMQDQNCLELYEKIEMPLIAVLAEMEKTGIKVEKEVLDEMQQELDVKIEALTQEIYDLAGMTFNISSPKQLGEILFEKLEIAKGKKNKTGYKTDVKVLEKLVDKHPIVEKILEYRNLSKLNSTYIQGLGVYILPDNKIHTIYKQTLTRTGRLSSTDPNLQNIPVREDYGRKIRKAFVPCYDVLLSADYSQIELRILAHLSKTKGLKDAFIHDADIHTRVASEIHGISEEMVTKSMRRTAKAVIFGIVYGISGFGLGENLHISKKDADNFIARYFELYPEVKEYMNKKVAEAHENGYVTTLFGRKRVIEEIHNPNYLIRSTGERMAMNTPIQGTSADIMKMAMINVYNRFQQEGFESKILLQVHDEIIVDCKNSELERVKAVIKEEMENVYQLEVPLKVEIDAGINWYEAK
ncbi:MAG: DNA polymerase I, partial [Bacilli bacterium]|nr:DNA polymerase I [Bacilli bacterium]